MIIVDIGSCHNGDFNQCKDVILLCKSLGVKYLKFQLFKKPAPNIPIPYHWMTELVKMGKDNDIDVFASVWDREGMDMLECCDCNFIKFAYSQRNSELIDGAIKTFKHVFVSYDVMDNIKPGVIPLYCIPAYPLQYVPLFEGLFPNRFKGVSLHSIGKSPYINAIKAGAQILEFHIKGNWESRCPDAKFALSPKEAKELITDIKNMEEKDGK